MPRKDDSVVVVGSGLLTGGSFVTRRAKLRRRAGLTIAGLLETGLAAEAGGSSTFIARR
jgi:Zn-dependent alcohol dehydrogenase